MAITFQSVMDNVREELDAATISQLTDDDMIRFCVDAWHEVFHSYPGLMANVDPITGVVSYAPGIAPDDSDGNTVYPSPQMDDRRTAIEAYVRFRVSKRSQLDREQMNRVKMDADEFSHEQGLA